MPGNRGLQLISTIHPLGDILSVKMPKLNGWEIFMMVIVGFIALSIISNMLEQHEFNKMTPSQHLAIAKSHSKTDLTTIRLALQHIAAIPENSSESAEAIKLKEELLAQETKISDANAEKAKAEANAMLHVIARSSDLERI